ncbi:MAG: S41 family peptidase [Verrucomicrobiota bacterium]|nr:S41 family peptidase [Verrucomicrobiota bacterium]
MLKRIFTVAVGAALGVGLTCLAGRLSLAWSLFPNRGLDRSITYFRDVMKVVNENYVDAAQANYDQLTHAALEGMVMSLDPHSQFLSAKSFDELEDEMSGGFGGIGVQIDMVKSRVTVVVPIPGTPGARAGLRHGDEILRVNGRSLEKLGLDEIVTLMRGKPRTKITLSVLRPATQKIFDVTLTREVIKVDSVRNVHMLPGHIGYIELTEFSDNTADQFGKALDTLLQQGATSLVLDLRNNPGGLLDAAVAVLNPFFKKGELIVYTQGRSSSDREEYRAEGDGDPLTLPMAVLINAQSASAAEIVAGALKDTGRAVIVGERSFGKGSVQSIFKLRNGEGLRLTTAHYYTPSGAIIHEHGIEPQIKVVLSESEDEKIELQMERDDLSDAKEFQERYGFAPIADRQLQAAADVLHGVQTFELHDTALVK